MSTYVDFVKNLKDMLPRRKYHSTIAFAIAAAMLFLQRIILLSELNDDFEDTDIIRWLILTIALPTFIALLGLLSNFDFSEVGKYSGILETFALTVFLATISSLLFDLSGISIALTVTILSIYPMIIIFLALYSFAAKIE